LLLLTVSIVLGLWLVFLTDVVILFLGALCFFFGVFYSYGPVPLSHGPYGEIVSGFFYGAVIPAIIVYINDPARLLSYSLSTDALSVRVNIAPTAGLLLLAVVPFCLTANVMLANNICDVERDVHVGRYTLPHYLGRASLHLFAFLYYAAYLSVVVLAVLRYLSPLSYLLLITLWPVQRNIRRFFERQLKEETFILAIKNFILISSVHCALIFLGGFLPGWGPL
jgi:1,4-dihydroxy-2-naphthoate octaprenyltransferase